MKRALTGILILMLLTSFALPALAAPAARASHPVGDVVELEGKYQVVKATKKAPAYAVIKLFAPIDIVLGGEHGIAAQVPELQLLGPVDPSLKGKNVRAKGMLAAADDSGAFQRPFALKAPFIVKLPKPTSVTLNETHVLLNKGEQFPLRAIVLPQEAKQIVSFSSNKTSVARVTPEGVIRAVGKGTATITATAVGGKKTTVKVDVVIPVTGINIDYGHVELGKVGEKSPLRVYVMPQNATNKTVTFTSSNPAVATVTKKGVIKAVGEGHATITVATHNDLYTEACEVVVRFTDIPVPVAGVTVSPAKLELKSGERGKLTGAVLPDNATNHMVNWSCDNPFVAEVDHNGWVTARMAGTATITVETNEGVFEASAEITVVNPNPWPGLLLTEGQIENRNLLVGLTEQLKLTAMPETLTPPPVKHWVSLNPAIASVNPFTGVVTGRTPGITLVYPDTGYINDSGTPAAQSIPVIVSKAALPVRPMTLNDFKLQVGTTTLSFTSTLDQVKALFPGGQEHPIFNHILYETNECSGLFDGQTKQLKLFDIRSRRASTLRGVGLGQTFTKLAAQHGLPSTSGGLIIVNMAPQAIVVYELDITPEISVGMSAGIDLATQTISQFTIGQYENIPE